MAPPIASYLVDSSGRRWVKDVFNPPPSNNIPDEVADLPAGWIVEAGDGQTPAIHLHDYDEKDRTGTSLGETGEWYPVSFIADGRVKPPKNIVNLQGTDWLNWEYSILGEYNFEQKAKHGDGTEDTNDDSIPVYLPDGSINPDKPRKQMVCVTGGAILNIIGTIKQGGVVYDVFKCFNYLSTPEKIFGYMQAYTWDNHPYLFTSRVNRKLVNKDNRTWISSRGVQAVSDGGVDENGNILGAKLKEWWPNPSKFPVCLPRFEKRDVDDRWVDRIKHYPTLPAQIHLYKNSLVVDGNLVEQAGGITIIVDAYCFYGSTIYVREKGSEKWYLADEMLVRSGVETGWYARATDYRCYAALEAGGQIPWMGDRGYGIPDPGVWRKDFL